MPRARNSEHQVKATLIALLICLVAAALEGAAAGRGVRQRFAELRLPPYSPPFPLWLAIGGAFYAFGFIVLHSLLASAFTPGARTAFCLLLLVLLANALWNVFFFRWRDLRLSFRAFIPYALLVAVLVGFLRSAYPFGAGLFLIYGGYLIFAAWWSYQLWQLNGAKASERDDQRNEVGR